MTQRSRRDRERERKREPDQSPERPTRAKFAGPSPHPARTPAGDNFPGAGLAGFGPLLANGSPPGSRYPSLAPRNRLSPADPRKRPFSLLGAKGLRGLRDRLARSSAPRAPARRIRTRAQLTSIAGSGGLQPLLPASRKGSGGSERLSELAPLQTTPRAFPSPPGRSRARRSVATVHRARERWRRSSRWAPTHTRSGAPPVSQATGDGSLGTPPMAHWKMLQAKAGGSPPGWCQERAGSP